MHSLSIVRKWAGGFPSGFLITPASNRQMSPDWVGPVNVQSCWQERAGGAGCIAGEGGRAGESMSYHTDG